MEVIKIDHITKDYGKGKGVFDISFSVSNGEVMGFLGPNGAGKTTAIRQLMGFIRPDHGSISVLGMDAFGHAAAINESLGYLPGEISFMDDMKGMEFIKFIARMKGIKDLSRGKELIDFFELDPSGKIRKMSKGMKQKIGLVCAFMQNPSIVVLDEPTSGLDPLMQNRFVELILEEKKKGTTILMSSHIFEEVEKTCDRTAIIKEGHIVAVEDMDDLRRNKRRVADVHFFTAEEAEAFGQRMPKAEVMGKSVTLEISGEVDSFLKTLADFHVVDMDMRNQSLEELFMHFYGGETQK